MSNKNRNHNADISNGNKGTSGTNITYDKNQGNRGKQLNKPSLPDPVKALLPTPNDSDKIREVKALKLYSLVGSDTASLYYPDFTNEFEDLDIN